MKQQIKTMKQYGRKWPVCFIFILIFIIAVTPSTYAENENTKNVLLLNSYHKGFPWTDNILKGIESFLKPEENNIQLIVEYMDTKSMGYGSEYKQRLYELYSYKYHDSKFDLIISSDDNAFNFLREYHYELYPGVPVVACGVNNREAPDIVNPAEFTGILETTPHEETIDLILNLHPGTKKIYLVIDETPSGKYRWGVTEQSFSRYKDIEFIRLSDEYYLSEIEDVVGGLTEEAVVIFFTLYRDKSGKYLSVKEAVSRITKASVRPVYTTHLLELPYGVVGGKVLGGFYHGKTVADIAKRILNGEKISSIPVVETSPTQYVFDYAQLKRWGIKFSELPDDSIILNEPESVFYKYRRAIIAYSISFMASIALIIALLIKTLNLRRTKLFLEKSEDRFKRMIKKSPLPITITDPHQNIVFFNDKFTELFGYTLEDVSTAEKWWEKAYPEEKYRAKVQNSWMLAIEKAEASNTDIEMQEWSLTIKDGTKRNCEFYMVPLGDISLIVMNDITNRKKAEDEISKQKSLFETMFNTIPDGVVITDIESVIRLANKGMESTFGYKPEDLLGKSTRMLYADKDKYQNTGKTIFAENVKKSENLYITRYKDISGRVFSGETFGTKLFDENKKWVGNLGVMRDVTDRERYERELKNNEELFRAVFEQAGGYCMLLEPTETGIPKILDANNAACKTHGYTRKEMIGRPVAGLDDEEGNRLCAERTSFILSGKTLAIESNHVRKDGSVFPVAIFANKIEFKNRTPLIVTTEFDISDRKKSEAERLDIEKKLSQAQKMESIGTLAGGIAHDFNNILFPIVGHTEMLLEDVLENSPFRESLNEIYTGSLRARDLVHQILAFSRQGTNDLKLMKMQPIIKEALKLIRSTIPTTISINQSLQPGCSAVKADPTQIHQILMNLTTNAYHAMEENGGELKVSLKEVELGQHDVIIPDMTPGLYACLSITDTGMGMDKNLMDKIFEPYFTTKEKGKGTGMGLSVVHGIVKSMNGEIQVHSELGKGTEFHIFLPIAKSDFEKQETQTNEPILGGNESVLLVDDEKSIIAMERQALERLGYQITSCTSSIEALEAFRTNPEKFDLVITDMAMPNMPGNKLAIELIKIRPDIPILLCTGFSESMSEEKIKSIGIKGLLMKPIIIKDLAKKIREVLDK